MADDDRIGARVAAIRKLRGWTARELARQASVSYSLLAKVESGAAPASPAFIGAVARALDERGHAQRVWQPAPALGGPSPRAGRRADADTHLGEARAISGTVPEGANHYGMEFGPANVGLHEVSAVVELADGTLAVTRAEQFERTGHLHALPAVRGQYRLDVARGWLFTATAAVRYAPYKPDAGPRRS